MTPTPRVEFRGHTHVLGRVISWQEMKRCRVGSHQAQSTLCVRKETRVPMVGGGVSSGFPIGRGKRGDRIPM